MRKSLLTTLILLSSSSIWSQSVTGRLLDSLSQEPISYAHIYSKSFDLGTISNDLGEFEIKLPKGENISLMISHIAYYPVNLVVKYDTILNIRMSKNIITLQEVEVTNERAIGIAEEVMTKLRKAKASYGRAFYRQLIFQDTLATEFIEAFYNVSFSQNGIEEFKVEQARFARKKHDSSSVFVAHTNFSYLTVGYKLFTENKETVFGKPFAEIFFKQYNFILKKEFTKGQDSYAIIGFMPKKEINNLINSYGYFIYNTTQKRLVEYRASVDHGLGADNIDKYVGDKNVKIINPKYSWIISFSDTGNLIDYILVDYSYDLTINNKVIPSYVSSKMVFYEKNSKPHKKLREPGITLEDFTIFKNAKYKPKFWRDNPIIKRTPKEEEIISSFEKENAFGSYFK